MEFMSNSPEETLAFAQDLGQKVSIGTIVCLCGALGAGKTVFAKGFAKGLGVTEEITSPTFTIMHEYEGRLSFYHFDAYRLQNAAMARCFDFDEYFDGGGVCLVEWAENIIEQLPKEGILWIDMKKTGDQNSRVIQIRGRTDDIVD